MEKRASAHKTRRDNMRKIFALVLAVMLCLALTGCRESERNKIGSSIDWGDGYYWNSQTESVEKTLW